jgi:hypothetical protein
LENKAIAEVNPWQLYGRGQKVKGEIKIALAREQRNPFTILSISERATQNSLKSFFGQWSPI